MATSNEIYGMIGAAKAFSSSVSYSLGYEREDNKAQIESLQKDLENHNGDEKEIKRKIKRLKRRNVMNAVQYYPAKYSTVFLVKLCAYLDISIEMVIKFIANMIVYLLPPLEVSVKMLLLTNIKKMLSCAVDPKIPDEWRNPGVILNEAMLDPREILKSSPYSKWGRYNYFGAFYDDDKLEPRPTFELARAEDMNAFLWFAKNCAKFVSPNIVGNNLSTYFDVPQTATLFSTHEFKGRDEYRYVEGSTFKYSTNSNTTFLCENRVYKDDGVYYTIVPATDRWTGVNWYKDRTSITGLEKRKDINYDKSKPLFNIEYLSTRDPETLYPDGNFRFRILPKPFTTAGGFVVDLLNNVNTMSDMLNSTSTEVTGKEITSMPEYKYQGIQSPIPYAARFNEKGEYDRKGRYSINTLKYYVVEESTGNVNGNTYYAIKESPELPATIAYLRFNRKTKTFTLVTDKTSNTELGIETKSTILTECYTGNTVYEFNYDYVVSMKLFDAQEIATGIVDALMNINIPLFKKKGVEEDEDGNPISNSDQVRIDTYIDKLVEKMIDTEDGEFTDCFYTFSNEGYESMEQEVADKLANSTLVTDNSMDGIKEIYDIIDSYDGDATLNERVETISLALTKAANACGFTDVTTGGPDRNRTSGTDTRYATGNGNRSIEDFIQQMIQFLMSALVNALLTPKVVMLIQVNRMMMGTYGLPTNTDKPLDNYDYRIQDLLNGLEGLLKSVIRQIIDTVHKELLKLILERLSEMMAVFIKKLGVEYAMKWVLLLKQLLACFKRNKNIMEGNGGYGNGYYNNQYTDAINNIIDQVDYADIDTLIDEIMPNTNPC